MEKFYSILDWVVKMIIPLLAFALTPFLYFFVYPHHGQTKAAVRCVFGSCPPVEPRVGGD